MRATIGNTSLYNSCQAEQQKINRTQDSDENINQRPFRSVHRYSNIWNAEFAKCKELQFNFPRSRFDFIPTSDLVVIEVDF
jgi:hypothetical protein